jgi:hypothetical protein
MKGKCTKRKLQTKEIDGIFFETSESLKETSHYATRYGTQTATIAWGWESPPEDNKGR